MPPIGNPVALVSVAADGVPKLGVTSVGEVANTSEPEPVSSEITPASCADVVEAKTLRLFDVVVSVPLVGSVSVVVPVAVSVMPYAPTVVNVEPSASAIVAPFAGAVNVYLLILPDVVRFALLSTIKEPVVAPLTLRFSNADPEADAVFVTAMLMPLKVVPAAFQVSVRL